MRKTAWMLAAAITLAAAPAMAADGEGLMPNSDRLPWARWQGRLSLGTVSAPWRLGVESPALKLSSASLMGDYYFGPSLAGAGKLGGLRATGGLIFGPRGALSSGQPGVTGANAFSIGTRLFSQSPMPYSLDAPSENATVPYLGVGYTGLSVRNRWSFSADLGLVAQSPGTVRLGRVVSGGQGLDDVIRDMRLAPLLQLGVSYSF